MMKAYINMNKDSNLHFHQPFSKRVWLMKRERTHRILHHFSFGEWFDEAMMSTYCIGNKYIVFINHQFIEFSSLNKSVGKDMRKLYNTHNSVYPSRATRFRELRIPARRVEQFELPNLFSAHAYAAGF